MNFLLGSKKSELVKHPPALIFPSAIIGIQDDFVDVYFVVFFHVSAVFGSIPSLPAQIPES